MIDVRDPQQPRSVAQVTLPFGGSVRDVALVGDSLVIADGTGRLMIFDARDVRDMPMVADMDLGAVVVGLKAVGERLWVGWHDGQRPRASLFDLSDPVSPEELWTLSTVDIPFKLTQIQGHLVMLAGGALSVYELPAGLPTPRVTQTPRATPTYWAPTATSSPTPSPSPTATAMPATPTASATAWARVWLPWARADEAERTAEGLDAH